MKYLWISRGPHGQWQEFRTFLGVIDEKDIAAFREIFPRDLFFPIAQ